MKGYRIADELAKELFRTASERKLAHGGRVDASGVLADLLRYWLAHRRQVDRWIEKHRERKK